MKVLSILLVLFSVSAHAGNTITYQCKLSLGTKTQVTPWSTDVGVNAFGLINYIDLDQDSYLGGVVVTNLDGSIKSAAVGIYSKLVGEDGHVLPGQVLSRQEVNAPSFSILSKMPSGEEAVYSCIQ